ncbi:MAG: hypothetical protein P4L84_29120 [Isosphaeraceae bacterium]|nr:hypothetical protein [Isosphaeraceae bacterium]
MGESTQADKERVRAVLTRIIGAALDAEIGESDNEAEAVLAQALADARQEGVDGARAEMEQLRGIARCAKDDAECMADAVEALREIGDIIGCGHVDGSDERARLVRCVREEFERLKAELKPFQRMTPAEAEAELAAFDASGSKAEPMSDERIKEIIRCATATCLEQAGMTAERYRRAYRDECTLREAAEKEAERLTLLSEDKFRHIQGYCRAADEDRSEIQRLRVALQAVRDELPIGTDSWASYTMRLRKMAERSLVSPASASTETDGLFRCPRCRRVHEWKNGTDTEFWCPVCGQETPVERCGDSDGAARDEEQS